MAKEYNKIEVKDNMKISNSDVEETVNEKKKLESIVNTTPQKVKKNLVNRLITGVLGPEGIPGIGSYVNEEIVKPAVKNIIVDAVTSGINMIMYGNKGQRDGHSGYSGYYSRNTSGYRPSTNYSSRYSSSQQEPPEYKRVNTRQGVDEYVIADRHDAMHVLTALTEQADMYGSVSVADYYDLINVASKYTDNNIGWTVDTISRATIVPTRGGYIIKFPIVEVI